MRIVELALLLAVVSCADGLPSVMPEVEFPSPGPPWFVERDVATSFVTRGTAAERRFDLPEIMLGGAGVADVDQDGDLDVVLVQGGDLRAPTGDRDRLWRNLGGWSFADEPLEDAEYGMGAAFGDVHDDGWVDLYVTNVGPNRLHANSAGTFVSTDEARDPAWSASAAFGDPDGDGDLDLFVANYVVWSPERERTCGTPTRRDYCQPASYRAPARDAYFENDGRGQLTDRSDELGLGAALGHGLGVVFVDVDEDGRAEVFVANDGTANHLWRLRDDGFVEDALLSGCALGGSGAEEAGMGVAAFDLEHDGDRDLLSVHLRNQTNTLYVNRDGRFTDRTAEAGLAAPSLPWTAFGVRAADLDLDGATDLVLAHGRVLDEVPYESTSDRYAERDQLLRGLGNGRFSAVDGALPDAILTSRGLAAGDLDGDGDEDLIVTAVDAPVRLRENVAGDGARWLAVDVRRESGSAWIGAHVVLRVTPDSAPRHAWIARDGSYLSAHAPEARFGLGSFAGPVHSVEVVTPDGARASLSDLAVDTVHRIVPNSGGVVPRSAGVVPKSVRDER